MSFLFQKNFPIKLLLASTSIYRKQLLTSLGLSFDCDKPECNEESFKQMENNLIKLSQKLSFEKAKSLSIKYPEHAIIGGDQICHLENEVFSKPQTFKNAFEQLKKLSGKTHTLTTSFCIYFEGKSHIHTDQTFLTMRNLDDQDIETYLNLDQPFYCAGSYMFEKSGHKLFTSIETSDPSSIVGIPLLSLQTKLLQLANEHVKIN